MSLSYYSSSIPSNIAFGQYCVIGPTVNIGKNCTIGNRVTIVGNVEIGDNSIILDGTCIGYLAQHLSVYREGCKNLYGKIVIGNNTVIRENCTIHAPYSSDITYVGNNCFLMANTHVAHDCVIGNNVIMANNTALGGHCKVDDYANIGLNTCVHQFTHIGEYSMVGMGSVITKDVLPFHLVFGSRDDVKVSINTIGYGRNYRGSISLSAIKKFRINKYDIDIDVHPELLKVYTDFKDNTKNGIYR